MAIIGYARVSTESQDLAAQLDALDKAGCEKVYAGKQSGKSDDNAAKLDEMVEYVRTGDVVLVTKLDRLGRSLNMILNVIQQLTDKGVAVRTLDGQVNTESDNAMARAMTQLLGVFAELEHSIIVDRLQSGRERTGRLGGRPPKLDAQLKQQLIKDFKAGESKSSLANRYDVSRSTVLNIVGM